MFRRDSDESYVYASRTVDRFSIVEWKQGLVRLCSNMLLLSIATAERDSRHRDTAANAFQFSYGKAPHLPGRRSLQSSPVMQLDKTSIEVLIDRVSRRPAALYAASLC
jgi:hypothetical protein